MNAIKQQERNSIMTYNVLTESPAVAR